MQQSFVGPIEDHHHHFSTTPCLVGLSILCISSSLAGLRHHVENK